MHDGDASKCINNLPSSLKKCYDSLSDEQKKRINGYNEGGIFDKCFCFTELLNCFQSEVFEESGDYEIWESERLSNLTEEMWKWVGNNECEGVSMPRFQSLFLEIILSLQSWDLFSLYIEYRMYHDPIYPFYDLHHYSSQHHSDCRFPKVVNLNFLSSMQESH